MPNINQFVSFLSGTPQFRITECSSAEAPVYTLYSQADLENDLRRLMTPHSGKPIRTFDKVCVAFAGEVVFSLVSGMAAIVQAEHDGYLLTQNFVTLAPSSQIDARYLVYLLNENRQIKHQFHRSRQGSSTMKYTIKHLAALELPPLPPLDRQKLIGELYHAQLRLDALRKRATDLETILVLEAIRKADES